MLAVDREIVALAQRDHQIVDRMNRPVEQRQERIQARHLVRIAAADTP